MERWFAALALIAGMFGAAAPASAQEPNPELRRQAEQVVAFLRGEAQPAALFSPSFLRQVPEAQLQSVTQQLIAQHGAARRLVRIEAESATSGTLFVEMERATLRLQMAIERTPPHQIIGLLVAGVEVAGDTPAAVAREIAALPGETSFAVARLGSGAPTLLAGHAPERALAIGSTFKLFILAELSRQVQAGQRRWSDVVRIDRRSLPSGQLQDWPEGAPVTLHTLAALMISVSDNTATDILLHLTGRENVEAMMGRMGVAAPARNRPFLGTLELFALKAAPEAEQRAFIAANEDERRRLLRTRYAGIRPPDIDPSLFGGQPLRIGELEWFASASDLARVMDWMRRHADEPAREIMAINDGLPGGRAAQGAGYVGFKGGSEPGVINLTWLVRNAAGTWHVVTGSWNNPAAPVEEARFIALLSRAVAQVR
jgi:beta-lactamase class A